MLADEVKAAIVLFSVLLDQLLDNAPEALDVVRRDARTGDNGEHWARLAILQVGQRGREITACAGEGELVFA